MSEVKVEATRVTLCNVEFGSINASLESVIDVITKLLNGDAIVTIRCGFTENSIASGLSELKLVHKEWNGQSLVYTAGRFYDDKLRAFRDQLAKVRYDLTDPPDPVSSMSFDWNTGALGRKARVKK